MAIASLLTLLALAGVAAGLFMAHVRFLPVHLAAAGGGLLFGLSLFWVVPEIAESAGHAVAWSLVVAVCGALVFADRVLLHEIEEAGHVVGPLLAAAAVHSFVDGWSVRAIAGNPLKDAALALGLALHKAPEGLALGWICRRSLPAIWEAAAISVSIELLTLVGAAIEPAASRSGTAAFGPWWTAGVLSVIAGSFLFLGLHAILPNRKRPSVIGAFVGTLVLVACASLVRTGAV
ncbi:MAG: hypothetical protein JOY54_08005 [Acidobacteriaceae bacterium]|nr:hypothetical protein [Acidobacteriaceae bacterium]